MLRLDKLTLLLISMPFYLNGCSGLGVFFLLFSSRVIILLSFFSFFQIPFLSLRLYLSFSLLKASVWFSYAARLLSLLLCSVLSRWPAAAVLSSSPLSSAPLLLVRAQIKIETDLRRNQQHNQLPTLNPPAPSLAQAVLTQPPSSCKTVSCYPICFQLLTLTHCTNCKLAGQSSYLLFLMTYGACSFLHHHPPTPIST